MDVTKIGILKADEASLAIRALMDTGFYSWSCSSQAGGQWCGAALAAPGAVTITADALGFVLHNATV